MLMIKTEHRRPDNLSENGHHSRISTHTLSCQIYMATGCHQERHCTTSLSYEGKSFCNRQPDMCQNVGHNFLGISLTCKNAVSLHYLKSYGLFLQKENKKDKLNTVCSVIIHCLKKRKKKTLVSLENYILWNCFCCISFVSSIGGSYAWVTNNPTER